MGGSRAPLSSNHTSPPVRRQLTVQNIIRGDSTTRSVKTRRADHGAPRRPLRPRHAQRALPRVRRCRVRRGGPQRQRIARPRGASPRRRALLRQAQRQGQEARGAPREG